MTRPAKAIEARSDEAQERWVPAVGFEGRYEVSSFGQVRNAETLRILKGDVDRYGYRKVSLRVAKVLHKRKVHLLVCEAFHGPRPDGLMCAHLDGDSSNNREQNLVWATRSENVQHSVKHGTHNFLRPGIKHVIGIEHHSAKLSEQDVVAIRAKHAQGQSSRSLAREYGLAIRTMAQITNNETWRHLLPQGIRPDHGPTTLHQERRSA